MSESVQTAPIEDYRDLDQIEISRDLDLDLIACRFFFVFAR